VKEVLLQRYPYLAEVPKDTLDGVDVPLPPAPRIRWKDLDIAHMIPVHGVTEKQKDEERNEEEGKANVPTATDGVESEDEEYTETWHDIALSIAAELMDQARAKVREMGYTTSAVCTWLCYSALNSFDIITRESRGINSWRRFVET
jgi:DNA polymerase eta